MFQIIWISEKARWEIKDTTDYFVQTGDTFHDYKFETEEDATGVYMHHALRREKGFSLQYMREIVGE
jgi:hypothetical protein